jgi:DNA polymerase-3 subunit gamma/tau
LEVGEQTKDKYLKQSQKTSQDFLLKGIELANECDLKYKNSKNQRLLVELCLMQLASVTFDGEKKNSKKFIIPASYFEQKGITPIPVKKPEHKVESENEVIQDTDADNDDPQDYEDQETIEHSEITTPKIVEERPKILLNQERKRTSGLSLKSIKTKKEHLIKQMEVVLDDEEQPTDDFTPEQLTETWNDYIKKLEKQGKFNLASILSIDDPKIQDTTIHLQYPNSTNKVEIERHQYELLGFIRKALNNFKIDLSITVNEELEKQYAYTPKEKYEKLKKKNANLSTLKKTFDLDI